MSKQTDTLTDAQREKLPKYLRGYIEGVERERDAAVNNLAAYVDDQTESNVWFYDRDGNKVYLSQDASERLTVRSKCGKIHLRVNNYRDNCIDLSWCGGKDEYGMGDIAFIPSSYQQARLVAPENMHAR